jgi:formylglycine-generating enzyme required for sulfatase activity
MADDHPDPSPAAVEPGAMIGPYRVAGVLADGPSGTVYEAVEAGTGRRVALRHLPDRLANDPPALDRFLAAAGVGLGHPNLAAAVGVTRQGGDAFLIMEFVGGRTVSAGGRMPWRLATRVVRDAARGLAAVHAAGLIHGQVRPGHLLIAPDGAVKLTDLGVAAAEDVPANPACIAPEQIRGEPADARTDLYALGAVYFTLLTGKAPFADAGGPIDVYDAVLHRPVPTVRAGLPDIPLRCDAVVQKAMAKDPAARYPSAEALATDLDALLATDEPSRPAPLPKLPRRPNVWGRLPGLVGGLLVLAALAAGGWYLFGPHPEPAKPSARSTEPELPTVTNSVGMTLVRVPAGVFMMGDPLIADATPHPVKISKPFLVGAREVTQAQYRQVTGGNPSQFPGDTRPVEKVTWAEAVAFCEKLSARAEERAAGRTYRLPTEAEWEYACRAGAQTAFCLGPTLPADKANTAAAGYGATTPVGTYPASRWGLYDVHGNVWEWCADWYDLGYYAIAPPVDPPGPEAGTRRVTRGGSWQTAPGDCRSAFRNDAFAPDSRSPAVGFRVVCVEGGGK